MSLQTPRPFRAVLFDFDDTLVDTDDAITRLNSHWYRTLPPQNRPSSEQDFNARMFEPYPMPADLRDVYIRMLDIWPGCFPSVDAALEAHNEVMPNMISLDSRVESMLLDLRESSVPVGVVTNGPAAVQWAKLRKTGVADLVDAAVVSGEFGVIKPHPAIFRHALGLIGAGASETLFVGDNPEADIAGAAGVGMSTAWMSHGRTWRIESCRPTHTIDAVREVRPLLGV